MNQQWRKWSGVGALVLCVSWLWSGTVQARVKTPSDVYAYGMVLKQEVAYLRQQMDIKAPFPQVPPQQHKYPRHVIQKALEILNKINQYRIAKGYGRIYIPPYPAREITPSDVFDMVNRLNNEVTPFIRDKAFLKHLTITPYHDKTPNDVYQLLWSISMAFDALLGVHGYTPTDVYVLSKKLVQTVSFIASSQNQLKKVPMPKKQPGLHPNHALYKSYDFLKKVAQSQHRLWIPPADVPARPQRVVTPTDVYDSIQFDIAELQRVKYRLGIERYFKEEPVKEKKTPSDVVQNLVYATAIYPEFSLQNPLVQYPVSTLNKTPNDVYGVVMTILKKLQILKRLRGISQRAELPPFIEGLKPIHTYQKGLEVADKVIRFKVSRGLYPSEAPRAPLRAITPTEVYELVLRLDGMVTYLLHHAGYSQVDEYLYQLDKPEYEGKTPSDVYFALWRVSNEMDVLLAKQYSPNETYQLANKIEEKVCLLLTKLRLPNKKFHSEARVQDKTPKDVFKLTLQLYDQVKHIQYRLNMSVSNIIIPEEKTITPDTVYNAMRILNAGLNEVLIHLKVDDTKLMRIYDELPQNKTPTDVFRRLSLVKQQLQTVFDDQVYQAWALHHTNTHLTSVP